MSNPFFHGNPAAHDRFIDRQREVRRVVGRIVNQGQSTAIVGEPRSGKTSLLSYLAAPELREALYGPDAGHLLFTYLDAQTLGARFTQARFWDYALRSLHERAVEPAPGSTLAQAYAVCQSNDFGAFVLERLLARTEQEGWRLVLMLDEFDVLLHHPTLNRAEFFGSLRSLASRSRGALALVIASRRPLGQLNRETQELSRTGSPFFNIFAEVVLGAWPEGAVDKFLAWAGERFTADDRRFLQAISGQAPYLLQVAASALWGVYEEEDRDQEGRWRRASQDLYDTAAPTLEETWRGWDARARQAFLGVALAHSRALGAWGDSGRAQRYEPRVVTSLLRDAFTDRDLRRFCRDRPLFAALLSQFGSDWSLEDMIDVVVEHCQKRLLVAELLSEVQACNPRQYERYASRLEAGGLSALLVPGPELRALQHQGFVVPDAQVRGGWRVGPLVALWWLAGELAGATSSAVALDAWLQAHGLHQALSPAGRETLRQAGEGLAALAAPGAGLERLDTRLP
jgi:hypothetical protein